MPTGHPHHGKAISANSVKNNGGVVVFAGNAGVTSRNAPVTNGPDVGAITGHHFKGQNCLVPPATDEQIAANANNGPEPVAGRTKSSTYKPYSGGTFGYGAAGVYNIYGFSTLLSGVASTKLAIPAGDAGHRRSFHKVGRFRSAGYLLGYSWVVNGLGLVKYTKTTSSNIQYPFDIDGNSFNPVADDSIEVTRAIPGTIYYHDGSPTTKETNITAKTGS